jgi:hypothetical protein
MRTLAGNAFENGRGLGEACDLLVVRSRRCHVTDTKNKAGFRANLRCVCGAQQAGSIRMSSKRLTAVDCLRELGRLIQRDHANLVV